MIRDAAVTPRAAVIVPIRSFSGAKARLADVLDEHARATLFRRMADRVVDAAAPMTVAIVTSAADTLEWAAARGLHTIDDPGSLDGAAEAGVRWARDAGFVRVVIAHADLPQARSLTPLAADLADPVVALVPCHRDDGTNVLSVPVDAGFRFAYGPGSFVRHTEEARRLGLDVRIVRAPDLVVDVDTPDDLEHLGSDCAVT